MHIDELDFDVPPELIAQHPCEPRDAARLMVLGDHPGQRSHQRVADLRHLLRAGDLLVLNTTKVIPARLLGHKDSGGSSEILLVHPEVDHAEKTDQGERWRCMVRGKVHVGSVIRLAAGLCATVEALEADGHRLVRFPASCNVLEFAQQHGAIPLPPYIQRSADASDQLRYQSVFAQQPGSVAAPTASLHFTPELLKDLEAMGVNQAQVELRVGPGTFKPVAEERVEDHPIHREWCCCPAATVSAIDRTRASGGRVIAVGTTVVRTLESAWTAHGLSAWSGWTQRFLYPPQVIHSLDLLMTNFHLPRSTLLALVSCLVDCPDLIADYRAAIAEGYRLFSYGDAMLVPNRRLRLASDPAPATMPT